MNKNNIRFSIIIACLNELTNISSCLDSINNQTYKNYEILLVDGNSTDGTKEYLNARQSELFFFVSEPDDGIYDAWNKALDHTTGDWIYFLGADDVFASTNVLEEIASFMDTHYSYRYDLVCGSIQLRTTQKRISPDLEKFPYQMIPHQGVFHSKKIFEKNNRFSTRYKIRGDYDFFLRMWQKRKLRILSAENIIVALYGGGISMSDCHRMDIFIETKVLYSKHNIPIITYRMMLFFIKALGKSLICFLRNFPRKIYLIPKKIALLISPFTTQKRIRGSLDLNKSSNTYLWNCKIDVIGKNVVINIGENNLLKNVLFFIRGDNIEVNVANNVRIDAGEIWLEDNGSNINIGQGTTIKKAHLAATEGKSIVIGKGCMFSNNIDVRTGDSHSIINVNFGERVNMPDDVILGEKVWIGAHSAILKGANVGDNVVIATHSVVTKGCYHSNIILSGIPAKVTKENIDWLHKRI